MQLKSTVPFLTILLHLLFFPIWSNANAFQENPLTRAIQLFDKEKYAEAEPLFKKLLDDRPDDFMVNYFYGACRTENGHYSEQDLNYLVKASKEVNPLNIDYYFAIQNHAIDNFEKALAYYKLYKAVASANEQEKVALSLKMEQCTNKINPFKSVDSSENEIESAITAVGTTVGTASVAVNAEITKEIQAIPTAVAADTAETDESSDLEIDEKEISEPYDSTIQITEQEQDSLTIGQQEESMIPEAVADKPVEERINFNINSEITYIAVSNFKTDEGKNYFEEGNLKENELVKVMTRTEILREKYKTAQSRAEKDSIGQIILELEGESYELKNVVTQLFLQSKTAENGYWQNASPEETEKFIKELDAAELEIYRNKSNETEIAPESPVLIVPPVLIEDEEINSSAPKENPSGIVYKIQLGAFSRGIPGTLKPVFTKISVIRKVENYTDENGVVVYTTGNLSNYEDAVVMQGQVKQEGIKDPKIAAYLNGKRITLEQAKEIENKK